MNHPNRVSPFGVLEPDPARGTLMGNRGCLVNARGELTRRWQLERWITCVLEFRGRRGHPMMTPRRYTQLFFLDDATACAAGHRPCRECRRTEADAFHRAWRQTHRADTTYPAMDARLHRERTVGAQRAARADRLPDGAMVAHEARAWLVCDGTLLAWSHAGYTDRRELPRGPVTVLTPPSTVRILAEGWRPRLHPSAEPG